MKSRKIPAICEAANFANKKCLDKLNEKELKQQIDFLTTTVANSIDANKIKFSNDTVQTFMTGLLALCLTQRKDDKPTHKYE